MRLLENLAAIFIDTFGITRPTPQARHRSALFIMGMLLFVAILVVSAAFFLSRVLRS